MRTGTEANANKFAQGAELESSGEMPLHDRKVLDHRGPSEVKQVFSLHVLLSRRQAGEAGAVLELKVIDKEDGETTETALASAMAQPKDRDYAAELREAGAGSVVEMGAVFDGKRVWVAVAEAG